MANKSKKSSGAARPRNGDDEDLIQNYVGGNGDSGALPGDAVIEDIFQAKATEHADDAVDYEDIDELAEDEDIIELPLPDNFGPSVGGDGDEDEDVLQQQADEDFDNIFGDTNADFNNGLLDGELDNNNLIGNDGLDDLDMDGIYDDTFTEETNVKSKKHHIQNEEERQFKRRKLESIVKKLETRQVKRNLKYHYPEFKPNRPFNNHKLFLPSPKYFKFSIPPIALKPKSLVPTKLTLEVDHDQKKIFKTNKYPPNYSSYKPNITEITDYDLRLLEKIRQNGGIDTKQSIPLPYLAKDGSEENKFSEFSKDLILATADWDDEAIMNGETVTAEPKDKDVIFESQLAEEDEDEHIFNGQLDSNVIKLDMNDPTLLFEKVKPSNKDKLKSLATISNTDKLMAMKLNISNDKQYELFEHNYNVKVRNQIGNLNIEHSVPAIRLQSPYYKVKLPKEEARAFHRPKFSVRPGTLISFLKVKQRKRKKDKGKTSKEIFSKTTDLTIGDNATLIATEYTEEFPLILSGYGMGSKLINYYRREKPDDNSRPKASLGETHVLGVEDRSPFWNYGYVAKGDFVPTLYNNMLRAPIYKHEKKSTDFLLVRSRGGGSHQKYYLRNVDHLFGVGHTFPSVEVPAPHSRKVTNTSKNRLKMIVYRTMNKKGKARINVKDISHHFPDQNDMQNRQRLKEFMEYQRSGEDQGYWRIKNSTNVPDEDNIRSMITPEDVSLLDSMQAGQQLLEDLTIFLNEEQEKEKAKKAKIQELENDKEPKERKKDKKEELDEGGIDDQLTSWNLTRNFILSNQTKSMLQLNGEGDPTGIGIGYSFLKTSQKSSFTPYFPPPKENVPKSNQAAYQQRLYEEEVNRIWYTQRKSLTADANGLKKIYSEYKPINHDRYLKSKYEDVNSDITKTNKALKISRRFRDENGIVQRKVEVIKDPRLIKAYLRRKKQIEDDLIKNSNLEDIIPTNDKELNKIRRKALEEKVANLERRAKHNKGRKTGKDGATPGVARVEGNSVILPDGSQAIGGKGIGKGKSKMRRCKTCGAFGHITTNKSCPLYNQSHGANDGHEPTSTTQSQSPQPIL